MVNGQFFVDTARLTSYNIAMNTAGAPTDTMTVTFPYTYTRYNTTVIVAEVLPATHVSPETAYVIDDYPAGFTARCQKRCWLEFKPGKGVRFVAQTSNHKRPGAWNAPKAGTYSRFGSAMFLDEKGHVQHAGLSEYSDGKESAEFQAVFAAGVPEAARTDLADWVAAKVRYDALVADGMDWREAGRVVALERAKAALAAKKAAAQQDAA